MSVTIRQAIDALNIAASMDPLGDQAVLHICSFGCDYIPINDIGLELDDSGGATMLVSADKLSEETSFLNGLTTARAKMFRWAVVDEDDPIGKPLKQNSCLDKYSTEDLQKFVRSPGLSYNHRLAMHLVLKDRGVDSLAFCD